MNITYPLHNRATTPFKYNSKLPQAGNLISSEVIEPVMHTGVTVEVGARVLVLSHFGRMYQEKELM